MDSTKHSMTRRAATHDYSRPGIYHITLQVSGGVGSPLGMVTGNADLPDGHPDAPRVELSPVGQMVERELTTAISARYPMTEVQEYIVMPDHLHFLLVVKRGLVTANGHSTHLGHIIKGFKYGCNRRYWEMLGLPVEGKQRQQRPTQSAATVPADSVGGGLAYPSLFSPGFCDVMPVDAEQLATQRTYILGNPRSRLLRTSHRDWLMPCRGSITTALSLSALQGYLRRECAPSQATAEALATLAERLLLRPATDTMRPTESAVTGCPPTGSTGPFICCDSYGNRALLEAPHLLPVVCHRRDKARLAEQKARCLAEAAAGTILVSPRIAKSEQEIIDEAVQRGFPVALVADNGFPERYHPSATQTERCAEGRLLLISPWRYRYRGRQEAISVPECKTMNCLSQAICRTKDSWWKEILPPVHPTATYTYKGIKQHLI